MNDRLRAARERTASLICPDDCLSRQELAELINSWVWDHHHKVVEASANWVGQLERGKIRWPGRLYREALRAIFGVSTDAALGFANTRRAVVKLDVKRKQFLNLGVGALTLGPLAALLDGVSEPTPIPHRIGTTEIEQIRTAETVFAGWDFTYGGGLAREAVMGQLRWSARLLDESTCPARLSSELHSAVGALADTAGYMAFDAGAYDDARRVFRFALTCAEKAGDWDLRAVVLDSMALLEIRVGQPDEGLTLAEQALVRADRLTETVQGLLHTTRSRALAKMRRGQDTLIAVGAAEDHFAQATPANDPPFLDYWNAAFLTGNTGQALFDLAIAGHHCEDAADRLTTAAAEHHTAGRARSQAICLTKLASLTMVTGDPIQAAAIGIKALNTASTIRSHRVTDDLRELFRYAAAHQHRDEVAHLRHRISTLLVGTTDQ
ncbi:MAG: helix-turn-helix domain-containing protein [Pseudonocardiaceae bacterium]